MPRVIVALLVAAAALVAAAPASAVTITCDPGEYLLLHGENPTIENLKAHNLPRKTSGYAPRCLVAEAIVGRIQDRYEETGALPATVRIYGAAWSGGRWNCTYGDGRGTCRKRGKPRRRVTMRIG
jgi:hypothetical protein